MRERGEERRGRHCLPAQRIATSGTVPQPWAGRCATEQLALRAVWRRRRGAECGSADTSRAELRCCGTCSRGAEPSPAAASAADCALIRTTGVAARIRRRRSGTRDPVRSPVADVERSRNAVVRVKPPACRAWRVSSAGVAGD